MPDGRTIPFDAYNVLYRETHEVKHWQNGHVPNKITMPAPYGFIPKNGNGFKKSDMEISTKIKNTKK